MLTGSCSVRLSWSSVLRLPYVTLLSPRVSFSISQISAMSGSVFVLSPLSPHSMELWRTSPFFLDLFFPTISLQCTGPSCEPLFCRYGHLIVLLFHPGYVSHGVYLHLCSLTSLILSSCLLLCVELTLYSLIPKFSITVAYMTHCF